MKHITYKKEQRERNQLPKAVLLFTYTIVYSTMYKFSEDNEEI